MRAEPWASAWARMVGSHVEAGEVGTAGVGLLLRSLPEEGERSRAERGSLRGRGCGEAVFSHGSVRALS